MSLLMIDNGVTIIARGFLISLFVTGVGIVLYNVPEICKDFYKNLPTKEKLIGHVINMSIVAFGLYFLWKCAGVMVEWNIRF